LRGFSFRARRRKGIKKLEAQIWEAYMPLERAWVL
jgi:hypothetical protein